IFFVMEGNNNWPNYDRNPPRGRPSNSRGYPRPDNDDRNMRYGELPPPYTGSGNRQNNPHRYYNNPAPNHETHEENFPNYFKTKKLFATRSHSTNTQDCEPTTSVPRNLTPFEQKIDKLINAVRSQEGVTGLLVLLQTELENPTVILQNAVQGLKNGALTVIPQKNSQVFELAINGEKLAEGVFGSKQVAKNVLCETVIDDLKKKFKRKKDILPPNAMEGSKAHLMMLKMGWGGKGLGSKEQGEEKTVAETLTQNVTKEGLGSKNVMGEIHDILEQFAGSVKVTTLAFDSGFTKDERAHIHTIASKFNLKSKSEGKDENRRITISKKIARWDLVKELLLVNCENDSYKLIIPSDFENIWHDE
ncbi:hypothetical protein NQ314_013151, partial [Rhamnusium bicolor]